ncbi:MAG TPA: hypothetical protein VHK63_07670 [Candidatus Limnocylindria bacterium]|nr:hypothetical protein [Candidatus Limnocylindria bacterium]
MREGGLKRVARASCAAWLFAGSALVLSAAPAAAQEGLVVVVDAIYDVQPESGRVRVTLDSVATSHEPDTDDGRVFFSGFTFAVPAGATNLSASSGGAALAVRIVEETNDYRAVEVTFSRGVFFQESYAYSVAFELVDAGGRPDRDVRIGRSVVAFPVWAFGTDSARGSSVRVQVPAGYRPTVQGSPMSSDRGPAGTVLRATPDNPFDFFAYVSADRPGAYSETSLEIPMQEETARITLRAWDDDPSWAERTGELLREGLPILEELIGVPYPHTGSLRVEEAAVSRLGEYAGIYDPQAARIRVRYDADAFVTLHEAAHLWFNHRLLEGRWIGEAWAEFYSIEAGEAMGEDGFRWELTSQLRRSRIPLNDWGAVGREDLQVEDFAYAASYEVATLVAGRATVDELAVVWRAAHNRELAYLPADGSVPDDRSPLYVAGWQRLLDLLEERTDERFDDLWAEWVVNSDEQAQLAARASTRSRYGEVLAEAEGWELPPDVRLDLESWNFEDARAALRAAEDILDDRDRVAEMAASLGLAPSASLQNAFESSIDDASRVAQVELQALDELAAADTRLDRDVAIVEAIGLVGTEPGAALEDAREHYQAGRLGDAIRAARAAVTARNDATSLGEARVTLAGASVLALDALVLVGMSAVRLRHERRRRRLEARML